MKRTLLLILTVVMVAVSALSFGCKKPEKEKIYTFEGTASGLEGKPWETDPTAKTKGSKERDKSIPESSEYDRKQDGILLYRQDFEGFKNGTSSYLAFSELGWYTDTVVKGAPKNSTAVYSIEDYENSGNRKLYITNMTGNDSYLVLFTSAQMGVFSESNYTVQYDLIYVSSTEATKYISLLTDYSGRCFNSFMLRGRGNGNNQCYIDGTWYTFDHKSSENYAPATNENSIVRKTLGLDYDETAKPFEGIDVSVRQTIDRKEGSRVYIRINTEGYPGTGIWTLVSEYSPESKSEQYFGNDFAGAAEGSAGIALKAAGGINGYVDNIVIWTGTGEEPEGGENILSREKKCTAHFFKEGDGTCKNPEYCVYCGENKEPPKHNFTEITEANDAICKDCGCYYSCLKTTFWDLDNVPAFKEGGNVVSGIYPTGQNPDNTDFARENDGQLVLISEADSDMLGVYCARLQAYGFERTYRNTYDGNVYNMYRRGDDSIYVYYLEGSKEIRIVRDHGGCVSPEEVNYTVENSKPGQTILYQYGVPMADNGWNIGEEGQEENKINCGMMYVVQLPDGAVIIIDGGGKQQFDQAEIDGFWDFLRKITGTSGDEKIRIAAWIFTHAHSDHMAGVSRFFEQYGKKCILERVMSNFPSQNTIDSVLNASGNIKRLVGHIKNDFSNDDMKFIRVHTGETFNFANCKIRIMYTMEDNVSSDYLECNIGGDFNNTSVVYRFEFDGISFMLLGDINQTAMSALLRNNSGNTLKADGVQIAHHCINFLGDLYAKINAKYILCPQAKYASTVRFADRFERASKYTKMEYIRFCEGTYGLGAKSKGKMDFLYERNEIDGGEYDGVWGW